MKSFFLILRHCIVLVLLGLWAGTAQSQCAIKNKEQGSIVECDMSFTLLTSESDAVASNAWNPDDMKKDEISQSLKEFSEVWCLTTAGNSQIGEISVFTDGRNADFHYYNVSGRAGAAAGGFRYLKPSAFIYNDDLGDTIAHEFAHSMFKIYDEYNEPGGILGRACFPDSSHDTRHTLMGGGRGDGGSPLRLSYSADYPRRQDIQTAQYECYGKSIWEVITQSAYRDDPRSPKILSAHPRQDYFFEISVEIPDSAELEATPGSETFRQSNYDSIYSCDEATITWVSSASTVMLMADHSTSMGEDQRLAIAQRAAKEAVEVLYAEALPVKVAVIGFDDIARTEVAPAQLDNLQNIEMIKSAIDGLVADGGTNLEAALSEAQAVFEQVDGDGQSILVIISDGETEQADLSYFEDNNIAVYTVELDTEGKVVLRDAITQARNRFNMEVSSDRLNSFLPSVLRHASVIRNNQLLTLVSFQAELPDNKTTTNTVISEMTDAASFILRWDEDAVFDSFRLRDPDGRVIDQVHADNSSTNNIRYLQSMYQAIYYIDEPMAGIWQVHIMGTGDFEYEAAVSSGIIAGINAGAEIILQEEPKEVVTYPEPIPILVNVGGSSPITGAQVVADITMPDRSTMSVELIDDGTASDAVAGDGLYSAILADYSEDGICEIKVTINNLDGEAMFDNTNVQYHPHHSLPSDNPALNIPPVPRPAPLFQRIVYDQVDVVNTKEKFMKLMLPPELSKATTITSIPSVNKGSIERPGQVDWYKFNTMEEGERYYIQTSNLMGYDNTEMVTKVSLYKPDGESLIKSSVRHRGSNVSSIEWLAPRADDYLLSVAHAEQGRGYYELTVSREYLLSEPEMVKAERHSRRGGFVGYTLLLLLLFSVLAFYRMHKLILPPKNGHSFMVFLQ